MKKTFYIFLSLCYCTIACGNMVPNGSFEKSKPGSFPKGWHKYNRGNIKAEFVVSDKIASAGHQSLLIINKSDSAPNKFADLFCKIPNMKVGAKYKLIFKAKGKCPQMDIFLGNWAGKWRLALFLKNLTENWQTYEKIFTLKPKDLTPDGYFRIRISTKNRTSGVWIDDFKLIQLAEVIYPSTFQNKKIIPITKFSGDISSLNTIPPKMVSLRLPFNSSHSSNGKLPDVSDFHANAVLSWNDSGLIFIAEVFDSLPNIQPDNAMYKGDSIQLRIDQEFKFNKGSKDTDREIGFMPQSKGVKTWCWQLNRELNGDEVRVYGFRDEKKYFIAAEIRWKFLNLTDWKNRTGLSFNLVINDNDGQVRRTAFLASGIHDNKSSQFNSIALMTEKDINAKIFLKDKYSKDILKGKIFILNQENNAPWNADAEITDANEKQHRFKLATMPPVKTDAISSINLNLPLAQVAPGPFSLKILVKNMVLGHKTGIKKDLQKEQLSKLNTAEKQLNHLIKELSTFNPTGKKSRYITLIETVLRRQFKLHRKELSSIRTSEESDLYLGRGKIIIPEIDQALNMLKSYLGILKSGKELPDSWEYVSSRVAMKNNNFYAENMDDAGKKKERITYFTGYGHFAQVVQDMPIFKNIGANLVQIELRPHRFFPTQDTSKYNTKQLDQYIFPALKRAWENNVKVSILLSPHHVPKWFFIQHPELKSKPNASPFEPVRNWNAPAYKKFVKTYLDMVIPKLKASPWSKAIHSICLTNEAVFRECSWKEKGFRNAFIKWLKKKYGSIAAFNKTTGRKFGSFNDVSLESAENLPVKYEFQTYKRETFAEFHSWMNTRVRYHWKEIPTSTKIMVFKTLEGNQLNGGVDPELFADFSTFHGNDNYMIFQRGKWISDWLPIAMYHDLQYSMKAAPVFNAENHVITDQYQKAVPYGHIYTATFQQIMHGVSSIVTWLWQVADYKLVSQRSSRDGNISYRPINIIAQGNAALDAGRVSDSISHFVNYNPEVALLYSPTSYILDTHNYSQGVKKLYESLSFCGFKLGFISEKQLASGQFKNIKTIFIPNARYIRKDAVENLNRFIKNGGRIITYRECLEFDQFGQALSNIPEVVKMGDKLPDNASLQKLIGLNMPLAVNVSSPGSDTGIVWRTVPDINGWLVNLVNYNTESRNLNIEVSQGMKIINLITKHDQPSQFKLEPLKPLLLKISK